MSDSNSPIKTGWKLKVLSFLCEGGKRRGLKEEDKTFKTSIVESPEKTF